MQNFQDTSEKRKQSYISAFSIYMTVPLNCDKKICNFKYVQFSKEDVV